METDPKISYRVDVKNLVIKGEVGDSITHTFERKGLSIKMDDENSLEKYAGTVKVTILGQELLASLRVTYLCQTNCARCTKLFERGGEITFEKEYLIGRRESEEEKGIVERDFSIEVGQPIYNEITLDIPMKPICDKVCKGIKYN